MQPVVLETYQPWCVFEFEPAFVLVFSGFEMFVSGVLIEVMCLFGRQGSVSELQDDPDRFRHLLLIPAGDKCTEAARPRRGVHQRQADVIILELKLLIFRQRNPCFRVFCLMKLIQAPRKTAR